MRDVATLLVCVLGSSAVGGALGEIIRGVNLGGWLVTEQWITPSLYDNTHAADEWTLCNELGKRGCFSTLSEHWDNFYTYDDLADIQNVGLNTVRIPLGYWAVDLYDYEPYVSGQYPYLIRAVQWAQTLNLSVLIDLHGAPGSQNGQGNSGLIGPVMFTANSSNTDRSLNVLKNLTEEFSRDVYGGTVVSIELLNEPRLNSENFTLLTLQDFYTDGARTVRGADEDMNVTVHDAFQYLSAWQNYNPFTGVSSSAPATDLVLDTHQYYAFAPNNDLTPTEILASVCNFSTLVKQPQSDSGMPYTVVGEFSLETGSAPTSANQSNAIDDQARRTWFRLFFEAQRAAYEPNGPGQSALGWIYWCWKTEEEIDTWSYRRGVEQEYIPNDVGDMSQLVFPVLDSGCVDTGYSGYTAPSSGIRGVGLVWAGMWGVVGVSMAVGVSWAGGGGWI